MKHTEHGDGGQQCKLWCVWYEQGEAQATTFEFAGGQFGIRQDTWKKWKAILQGGS